MTHRNRILSAYDINAAGLSAQYNALSTPDVLPGLPECVKGTTALDLGCGSGRDARWLATQGMTVDAFDLSAGMIECARATNVHPNVHFYTDAMPELTHTRALNHRYDLMLLSAVWMHLSAPERALTLARLIPMANPGATIFISLRHGPAPEDRPMFETSLDELDMFAGAYGLGFTPLASREDRLGRGDVWWEYATLKMRD